MQKHLQTWIGHVALVTAAVMTAAVMTAAVHAGPPALSSNPANLAIFPAKGQTPEQQRADESAAYDWATQQTRWDPYQAKAAIDQQGQSASAAADSAAPSPARSFIARVTKYTGMPAARIDSASSAFAHA